MSNNLPQIYNGNIFKRFFNYIRKLFSFKNNIDNEVVKTDNKNNVNLQKSFIQEIKIDDENTNKEFEKKKLMDNLKDNLQLLEGFSNEKLEKILQYYLKENEEKKKLLNNLST